MTSEPTTADLATGELRTPASAGVRWRVALAAFLGTLALAALLAVTALAALSVAYADRALPGVSVAGLPVGGLTRAQATALLRRDLPPLAAGTLTLDGPDGGHIVGYAQLGRDYDIQAMLGSALQIGRAGDPLQRAMVEVQTLTAGASVPPLVTYDTAAVDRLVQSTAASLDLPARDASVRLAPSGAFEVAPAATGRSVQTAVLRQEIESALSTTLPRDATIGVPLATVPPTLSTAAADAAQAAATRATSGDLTLTASTLKFTVPASTLRNWVAFQAGPNGTYSPTFLTAATRSLLESLAGRVNRAPKSARFVTGDGKVVGVLSGVNGLTLNVGPSLSLVNAALLDRATGGAPAVLALNVTTTPPKLTNAQAESVAPLMQMISSWTTYYTPYVENYWGKNIEIPTTTINGDVVMPGEWFDFWKAIGGITTAQGYGPGGAIINGHTDLTGALGGGICSCSTTLFNAALRAGLQIGARTNHYYYLNRYPVGLDATVYESGSDVVTMSFRNDTPYPILIRGINGPGSVTFQLFSVPTGRTISISTPIVKNYTYATDNVQYTTTLPPGQSNRVEWPSNGFESWVTVTVRDASGSLISQRTYYSDYARVNGLTLVGVAPGDPRLTKQPQSGG